MRSLQRGMIVCFAAVLAATTVATAQPSVTGASGTFGHKQSVTISGSNFGTKATAAPALWDDCSTGTYPTDNGKWDEFGPCWTETATVAYWNVYRTPIRTIPLPHSHAVRYIAGCHGDNGCAGVCLVKVRAVTSYPSYSYVSWYYRADDNWVFNCGDPQHNDNNFKSYLWSGGTYPCPGTGPYANMIWSICTGVPHPNSSTDSAQWVIDNDNVIQNPDQNGHNLWWNAATNWMGGAWIKEQFEIKLTDQNDGYIKLWDNGVLRMNYLGPTDNFSTAGTVRNDSIGGFTRNFNNANNYRYFADCYIDNTCSRIVLANNSNIDSATIIENQIPSAWSASSITATVNLGKFTSGTAYLFVYDSTGAHNATGYAVTINDSKPAVYIVATTPNASESGPVNGQFTVTRTGPTTSALTVNYAISGTATNTTDYSTLSGSVTIPSGSSTTTITVTPVDDSVLEYTETVILTLSASANYTVATPSSDTVYIKDNDSVVTLVDFGSSSAGNIYDQTGYIGWTTPFLGRYSTYYSTTTPYGIAGTGDGGAHCGGVKGSSHTFTAGEQIIVTWYNSCMTPATFTPKISFDDTNDQDLAPTGTWYPMNTVVKLIPLQSCTTTYTIGVTGAHSLVNVCRGDWYVSGVILDKIELQRIVPTLPTVTIAATDANASETGPDTGTFTVTRTGSTGSSLVVNYAVSGTATSGRDYTTLSGSVTIASGSSTAAITVTPVDNGLVTGSLTVISTIAASANYNVGSPSSGTVTIADTDSGGGLTTLVNFGSTAATDIYGPLGWQTVDKGQYRFHSVNGPQGLEGGTTGGWCWQCISGSPSHTFASGDTIIVTWYNDSASTNPTFTPKISFTRDGDTSSGTWYNMSTVGAMAAYALATSTYTFTPSTAGSYSLVNACHNIDNCAGLMCDKIELQSAGGGGNPIVTIVATTPNAMEAGPTNGVCTVTRTGSTGSSLTVNYTLGGTATNTTDYTTLSGSVTINSGSTTAAITVTPVADSLIEGDETVIVTLSTSANYDVGSANSATVTIADNDYLLVNFGSKSDGSDTVYGTSWHTLIQGRYSTWSAAGPYGFKGSFTGPGHSGGVSGTTAYTFTAGQVVKVTWYNGYTASVIAFNPQVSFDDTNDPDITPNGTWYPMTTVPAMAAGDTQTSTYTIDANSAGSHSLVNVSRMTYDTNLGNVILDKIELLSPDGGGLSPMIPTGGGAEAMTAQQPAQSLPAKRTVGWQPATPAAQPAPKK